MWWLIVLSVLMLVFSDVNLEVVDDEVISIMESNGSDANEKRPIWNIAHMINGISQIAEYASYGANAIEFDITFTKDGTPTYTYHGIPCDCFRNCLKNEKVVPYIQHCRFVTTPGHPKYIDHLGLLMMDLKLNKVSSSHLQRAGQQMAEIVLEHYWQKGDSTATGYILLSLPSIDQKDFIIGFKQTFVNAGLSRYLDKVGFDFSENEDLQSIREAYDSMNVTERIWQGDGITNCLPRQTTRLEEAIAVREKTGHKFINKVYWWTVDNYSTIRIVLRLGVDGMITNYPGRVYEILKTANSFRLASKIDNPWTWILSATLVTENGTQLSEEDKVLHNCEGGLIGVFRQGVYNILDESSTHSSGRPIRMMASHVFEELQPKLQHAFAEIKVFTETLLDVNSTVTEFVEEPLTTSSI